MQNVLIKLTLFEQMDSVYGALFLNLSLKTGKFIEASAILSYRPVRGEPETDWQSFRSFIQNLNASSSLKDQNLKERQISIRKFFLECPDKRISEYIKAASPDSDENTRNKALGRLLVEDVCSFLKTKMVDYRLACEMPALKGEAPASEDSAASPSIPVQVGGFRIPAAALVLSVNPVIDPVKGRPSSILGKGEKLLVRINDNTPLGKHVARSLSGTTDPHSAILEAELMAVERKKNNLHTNASEFCELTVLFEKDIYGRFQVQPSTRLAAAEQTLPASEAAGTVQKPTPSEDSFSNADGQGRPDQPGCLHNKEPELDVKFTLSAAAVFLIIILTAIMVMV